MWVIDAGRKYFFNSPQLPDNKCPPKILLIDIATRKVISRYIFPDDVAPYNASFLNDIVLDVPRKVAYISDTGTGPADRGSIIVYDHNKKNSRRFQGVST